MNADYNNSLQLILRYKNNIKIDCYILRAEMNLVKIQHQLDMQQPILLTVKKSLYPNYYKLLQLALTLPISSVKCERSISVLRRVYNYNRSIMIIDRLSNLSFFAINFHLIDPINNERIIL